MEAKMCRHVLIAGLVMTLVVCSVVGAAVVGPVYESERVVETRVDTVFMGDAVLGKEKAVPASGAIALCACALAVVGIRRPRTDVIPGVIRFSSVRS